MGAAVGVHGLAYERAGTGAPLVLIHGTGSSRAAWRPVVPRLAERHELVLVDLPGHGESQLPAPGVMPTPAGWTPLVADLLGELGVAPAHIAGFSLGGWIGLELAKLGRARSVTALAPAGLWDPRSPRASEISLLLTNRMTRLFAPLVPYAFATAAGRTVLLSQQFGRPWRLSADEAVEAARTMAATKGFAAHLKATNRTRFSGGAHIDVPVTVAFGSRERLLSKRGARRRDELPPHTEWVELRGCGHVPMTDDPEQVARVILGTAARALEAPGAASA